MKGIDAFWVSISSIRASLFYLVLGLILGVFLAAKLFPSHYAALRTIHVHLNLIGFVMLLIAGVGYHLFPVFAGGELYSVPLALAHFVLAQVALVGFSLALLFRAQNAILGFTALQALAWGVFAYNMLWTVWPYRQQKEERRSR
ncbi:MAG: cbb3-type cytochrome c oxidase subunit I [Candidatus Bipolaricaulia bacterium]